MWAPVPLIGILSEQAFQVKGTQIWSSWVPVTPDSKQIQSTVPSHPLAAHQRAKFFVVVISAEKRHRMFLGTQ